MELCLWSLAVYGAAGPMFQQTL